MKEKMANQGVYMKVIEFYVGTEITRGLILTDNPKKIDRQIKEVKEGNTTNELAQILIKMKGGSKNEKPNKRE
jgi:hypothetical protein